MYSKIIFWSVKEKPAPRRSNNVTLRFNLFGKTTISDYTVFRSRTNNTLALATLELKDKQIRWCFCSTLEVKEEQITTPLAEWGCENDIKLDINRTFPRLTPSISVEVHPNKSKIGSNYKTAMHAFVTATFRLRLRVPQVACKNIIVICSIVSAV